MDRFLVQIPMCKIQGKEHIVEPVNKFFILLKFRKKKHVVVNMNTVVPYDHLIIATGNQYQLPAPTEADVSGLATSSEV